MGENGKTIPDNEILEAVEELIRCLSMDADNSHAESSPKIKILFTTSSFLHYLGTLKIVLQTYIRLQSLDRSQKNLLREQRNQVQVDSVSEVDYKELKKCLRLTDEDLTEFNLELLNCCTQNSTEMLQKRISGMRIDLKEFKEQFEFNTGLFSPISSVISRHQSVQDDNDNERSLTAPLKPTEINSLGLASTLLAILEWKADVNILFNEILPKIDVPTSTIIEIFVDFWLTSEWNCSPQLFALNSFSIYKVY
uniref:Uncharacterized protein n=1 Tax=Ditylenchus dipsaci TaxID=166011 RepID=A0A915EPX9_9BILA